MDFLKDDMQQHSSSSIHSYMNELQKLSMNKMTSWVGSKIFADIFYLYLYHNYNKNCLPVSNNGVELILCVDMDNIICVNEHRYYQQSIDNICRCIESGIDILLIPVKIVITPTDIHSNLLVYRKVDMSIEIFEPHGPYFLNESKRLGIQNAYKALLADIDLHLPKSIQLKRIPPEQVCPVFGLQQLEMHSLKKRKNGGGYCLAWSMFFAELVLMHPTLTSKDLMSEISDILQQKENPNDYVLDVIIGYINNIEFIITSNMHDTLLEKKLTFDKFIQLLCNPNRTNKEKRIYDEIMSKHQQLFATHINMCNVNSSDDKADEKVIEPSTAINGGSSKKNKKTSKKNSRRAKRTRHRR